MRLLSFLLVLFSLFYSTSFSQWVEQSSSTNQHLRSVDFINSDIGLCVGNQGTILKTTDGGIDWQSKTSPNSRGLSCIVMVNENVGYAVGGVGTIIKTSNGGESWLLQVSPDSSYLYSVYFIDELNGWISTQSANVLITSDGGNNWIKIETGYTGKLNSIFFTTSTTGFTGGNYDFVLKTTDGGYNWEPKNIGATQHIFDIFFYSTMIGWSVGTNGAVLKTTNGGENWGVSYYSEPKQFLSIDFPTESKGWLGGIENEILSSDNGGQTWVNSTTLEHSVHDLDFLSNYLGWAVGEDGLILKYTDYHSLTLLYPNGGEALIIGVQDTIKWVSENVDNIEIEYSIDGGLFWATIINSYQANLGYYIWEVPNTPSNSCLVKVTSLEDPLISDISDSLFTITELPYINVTSPNGGEYWEIGNTYQVQWSSENIDFVKMFLTTDNGSSWELFAENVNASSGTYDFVVPIITSDQCKIKIVDESNELIYDESDSLFTIGSPMPEVAVISPNGFENWMMGSSQDIIWSSANVENVKIELSLTDGMSWETIVDSIPSTGLYTWIVNTSMPSFYCLIRISDVTDENIFDISDGVFTIDILPSVEDYFGDGIPTEYNLNQNFPNPFNPTTTIYYSIPELSTVVLIVYDVIGNEVSELVSEEKHPGYYEIEFDSKNLVSGIYFYKLQAGFYVETKKMILLK